MTRRTDKLMLSIATLACFMTVSCGSIAQVRIRMAASKSQVVQIPVLAVPKGHYVLPKGSRVVIAQINGDCADEVKDALMRRLIDNSDYTVLTRDNLKQVIDEAGQSWSGLFNSETATKLGELLGASLWIVGRVGYCGYSFGEFGADEPGREFTIISTLQIIDLKTGEVLVSSASEGTHIPRASASLDFSRLERGSASGSGQAANATGVMPAQAVASSPAPEGMLVGVYRRLWTGVRGILGMKRGIDDKKSVAKMAFNYTALKAAEDMANGFADKFFSRPIWEAVEMWDNRTWKYGEAIRLVKLGHCPAAVALFENTASKELSLLDESGTAEYLHNYGVSLLCSNQIDPAIAKFRVAYRMNNSLSTLKMLGLANKLSEWSLQITTEKEPEVQRFLTSEARRRPFSRRSKRQ